MIKKKILRGVTCINKIEKIPIDSLDKKEKKIFFTVDVLHHLDQKFEDGLLKKVIEEFDFVVIKDIDCHKKFGNFMNRLHDKIINGENIRDVNPNILINYLAKNGYKCSLFYIRKLWYPHFLIIAKR